MQPKAPKLIDDIRQSAEAIRQWTSSRTLEQYRDDAMLRAAVERNFEIIGEALNHLADLDVRTAERLGPYQQIIAFRNVLIHGYDIIDHDRVWHVIETDLPTLLSRAEHLLGEVGGANE